MKIEKNPSGYVVVIYEDNEVGAGHGLFIVNTKDFTEYAREVQKDLPITEWK